MSFFSNLKHRLEVPEDENGARTTNLLNRDIIPLPPNRRTWTDWDFVGFWAVINLSVFTWQTCSSLLSLGLSVWESMVIVIISKALIFAVALSHGWGGGVWHVGYPIYGRFSFGIFGSYLAVGQRIVLAIVWYAVQSFTGAMMLTICLSSIFPSFNTLHNTFPDSLPMTLKQFIGFIIYHVLSIPFLYIPPEKLKHPFRFVSIISFVTIFGVSIGCMVKADGAGSLLRSSGVSMSSADRGMAWMHGINTMFNSIAVGLANQPDFSRFVQRPGQQVKGQGFSILILGTVVPLFGLLGTSAAAEVYGDVVELNLWNPPNILDQWLIESYTSRTRAAAFFAAFGFFVSTLGLNTIDNAISGGIDLASMAPKWITVRRGAYMIMIVSIAMNPWQIVAKASVFLAVLGSYGCFLGPMIGVMTCDYYFVRHQKLKLTDLYKADKSSIYWFYKGFNWRGFVAWICGFTPGITGFPSVNPNLTGVPTACIKMFYISFIIGYPIGFLVHLALNKLFPPPGLGEVDEYDYYHSFTEKEALKLGMAPSSELDRVSTDDPINIPYDEKSLG
ncbi:hypothetical protein LJB42_002638 [Komagataella kurtzmanii]|nr:hypothetical protein LJB42_002638 [Komagataella kurtzmanii]